MLRTYTAILKGDHIEWTGEAPDQKAPVSVHITLLDEAPEKPSGRGLAMAQALQRIADEGGLPQIPDPREWQRQMRQDRPLPGRND